MFLTFGEDHCPVCGTRGVRNGPYRRCVNCETVFSKFGIVEEPFEGKVPFEGFDDIFDDN
ncbi:MAG: hypothetical protein ACP5E4_03255 [Candidatus Aenigmatarchaeota archaeon]